MQNKLHPVELAAWLHERLVSIHPFVDGNGRTARLLMNLALLQAGYNIITIPPVVRNDYIGTLQEAQLKDDIQPFYNFISEMVLESQKEYLRIIERLMYALIVKLCNNHSVKLKIFAQNTDKYKVTEYRNELWLKMLVGNLLIYT